jgi:hypothetical protein
MIRSIPGALLAAVLCLLQACGGGSSADAGGPAPQPHRLAAALPMPDGAQATLLDKLLLVAAGGEGLQVYDATLPDQPRLLATVKDPSIAGEVARTTAVAASGTLAVANVYPGCLGTCVADPSDRGELRVYDLSVPATPRLLARLPGAGAMALVDRRLLALRPAPAFGPGPLNTARLDVIDLSDPAQPRTIGSTAVAREGGLRVFGARVAIGLGGAQDSATGVQVVDLANPAAPRVAGTFESAPVSSAGLAPAAVGDRLFIGAADPALWAIGWTDSSGLGTPQRALLSTPTRSLSAVGTTLYAAQGRGLAVFNAANPAVVPVQEQTLAIPEVVRTVQAFDRLLLVVTEPVLEATAVPGVFTVRQPPLLRLVERPVR